MRLRKIKLAGFKSFVDPTTLIIPGNLAGIVGPNGCGKSNIIDAVTWVMGESSAKHLRGENLTDVIFNGSNLRQPVGQASVELVFDNSENKVGGQYSSYNEISIRRQITREGISIYFLNGARCRRKDIQSLFLGTGLGPRSYAIIEQGMISRLIEAKPEELRSFIEEAAGISRYRERRRETEHRIRHTRENLNRLNDIREELAKQLAHLQRQAKAAERYQALKQEERRYKSELLALQWRDLRDLADARAATVREHENRVERAIAELRAVESEIARRREGFSLANEEHSRAQSRYYEVGGVISQIEQKIQHADERVRALQEHIAGTAAARQAEAAQLQHDHGKLAELADELQALEPRLRGSRSENVGAHDVLNEAEQAIQGWQSEWDSFNETVSGISRQLEVDGARARFLEEGLEDIAERRSQLMQELEAADTGALETELAELGARQSACDTAAAGARVELQTRQAGLRALRTALEEAVDQLSSSRAAYQAAQAELASIESVLQGASPGGSEQVRAWLQATGLDQAPRIVDELEVDPAWSLAVETVLGHRLQDVCVEDLESRATQLSGLRNGRVGMISVRAQPDRGEDRYPRLAGKLSEDSVVHPLLADVFVADNLKRALQMRGDLQDGESVVTRDGTWIGRHWILANRPAADQKGILSGEYRLEDLRNRRSALDRQITGQEEVVAGQRRELVLAEEAAESAQQRLHALQESQSSLAARHAELRTRLHEIQRRSEQIRNELEDLEQEARDGQKELSALRELISATGQRREHLAVQREQLVSLRERHRHDLEGARARWQSTHEQGHELALRLESIRSQRTSLEQAIQRAGIQLDHYDARIKEFEADLGTTQSPIADLKRTLESELQAKIDAERELAGSREQVQSLEAAVRSHEQERIELEQRIQELRGGLDAARLEAKEVAVRLQTTAEQLQAAGQPVERLLDGMEEGAEIGAWRERLEGVERRIQRLGPINLAAIEEFQQLTERKDYLDRQHADLTEALNTLETAIRKIDRESRTRFKETFDRLNDNLKEMFPVLFGGGHAYLEMTGEDLLETGVSVMARPPGKRNTNIHLLSGGEKSLTAVALVFAIFKLNPAPFCILDEVDAPLDDTNVGRFCHLVSEMSQDVQFIFVTHNKITMEIAQQLLGVTMHEAGVSRLVSVDMDEAVQLAATA